MTTPTPTTAEPIRTWHVALEPSAFWQHRGPVEYLQDLLRLAGCDMTRTTVAYAEDGGDDPRWTGAYELSVTGTETATRLACVALNLHAEQTPWDGTPSGPARMLEALWATT